jgi:hypothetical protein
MLSSISSTVRDASRKAFGNKMDWVRADMRGAPLFEPTMNTPCDLPVSFPQFQQG